jgi:demethylspheroidene O-methyltransferase
VAQRWPHLQLQLFDLPAVAEQGAANLARQGFQTRTSAFGGDFFNDPLPSGADIISLVRVMHDHDDDNVLKLLRSIRRQLPADGTLLVAEPMAGHEDSHRVADAYFGFYLLAMGSGRARTPAEIGDLLRQAGFNHHRLLKNQMPILTQIILAT